MAKYTQMAKEVLGYVGGIENIRHVERCATRLRIHYVDKTKVDEEAIKGVDKIVGVVPKAGQVQIIIGPEVNDAFNEFLDVSGWKPSDSKAVVIDENLDDEERNFMYYVTQFGNRCAAIFMPIIPCLVTGGLILAIRNLLINYFGVDASGGTAQVLMNIFSAGFSFFPVWIGYTLANSLRMEPIMGAFLGRSSISARMPKGLSSLDSRFLRLHISRRLSPWCSALFSCTTWISCLRRSSPRCSCTF